MGGVKVGYGELLANNRSMEKEVLARKLHEWYLEATASLHEGSYNQGAQKSYDNLTEEQRYIDRYIAQKILENI